MTMGFLHVLAAFLIPFLVSVAVTPLVKKLALRTGKVSIPRKDRWADAPTPLLGGVAIFIAFLTAVLAQSRWQAMPWGILLGSTLAFGVGLLDDFVTLSPSAKLLGQLLAASVAAFSGTITAFFPWEIANALVSILWIVGLTNAINLLDNMDGLAGGMAFIAAGFMVFIFNTAGNATFTLLSASLAGSVIGYLLYNVPPASIFMGDSGSLFLGYTLASLAIAREPQASNVFAMVGVPTLLFLLPIFDTGMVTLTRLMRGQSPAVGGRDHLSHRLVSLGLTERQALVLLLGIAVLSGGAAILLERISYLLSLILIPSFVIAVALLIAFLASQKVEGKPTSARLAGVQRLILDLTYKTHVLEILLDSLLITFGYYVSYVVRFGFVLNPFDVERLLYSYPIVLISTLVGFYIAGVYRSIWRYYGIEDVIRVVKGAALGVGLSVGVVLLLTRFEGYSRLVFAIDYLLVVGLIVLSRTSFQFLGRTARQMTEADGIPVLIYGAGDAGVVALQECARNMTLRYHAVGFIDDDDQKRGKLVHGVRVLGTSGELGEILTEHAVEGVLVASKSVLDSKALMGFLTVCRREGIWVRRMRFDFEPIEQPGGKPISE